MRSSQPPRVANWLLRQFGSSSNNDVVIGDLNERYRQGRSRSWYWRQAASAILVSRLQQARSLVMRSLEFHDTLGGYMRRTVTFVVAIMVALSVLLLQGQAQVAIHAASDQAIPGWDRMQVDNHVVWVSPTVSLTSTDILRAEATKDANGHSAVGVVFNDAGAKKMSDLSAAQMNKLVAITLDGRVIFAPKVRSRISDKVLITGSASSGLASDIAQRIVDSVNKK